MIFWLPPAFSTEHDQRFSSTREGRKIHMGLSRHFCPIKLPSSGNLEYPLIFSVTFTENISNFPSLNILLYCNYLTFSRKSLQNQGGISCETGP